MHVLSDLCVRTTTWLTLQSIKMNQTLATDIESTTVQNLRYVFLLCDYWYKDCVVLSGRCKVNTKESTVSVSSWYRILTETLSV
jgi:hypothetical protein